MKKAQLDLFLNLVNLKAILKFSIIEIFVFIYKRCIDRLNKKCSLQRSLK